MKRLIKNYVKKRLSVAHPENYAFLRWLVGFVSNEKVNEDIICGVASWLYHTKNYNFPITDLFVIDNTIYLYTTRPSLWIGKRGSTIESCQDALNFNVDGEKVHDYGIHIMEDIVSPTYKIHGYWRVYSDDFLYM